MKNLLHRNFIFAALIGAGLATPSAQAHPLETLMPFVTRILWNSKSLFTYNTTTLLKQLTQPNALKDPVAEHKAGDALKGLATRLYNLDCPYPVLIKDDFMKKASTPAGANSVFRYKPYTPALDSCGRVILNANNTDSVTVVKKQILFDRAHVKEQLESGNIHSLIALLFHENEHLQKNHLEKQFFVERQIKYAQENGLKLALNDKTFEGNPEQHLLALSRLHEEEADLSMKDHPDLCTGLRDYIMYYSIQDIFMWALTESTTNTKGNPSAILLSKAIAGDDDAYKILEKDSHHPLPTRRARYLDTAARKAYRSQHNQDLPHWDQEKELTALCVASLQALTNKTSDLASTNTSIPTQKKTSIFQYLKQILFGQNA